MKRISKNTLLVALSACILLPFSSALMAEEAADGPDKTKWVCKLCAISNGWFGDWELGLIYVDDPTPRFADYRGLSDDGIYFAGDGDTSYRNEQGYYFDFYGRNLGLSSRRLEMRGGKQGSYELRAKYQEIPRYLGNGTVTPYQGVGTDTLILPDDWANSMAPTRLKSKRKILGGGLTVKMGSNWKVFADAERQKRSGTQAFGGATFPFNGAWFPAPLNNTTKLFNVGLQYADRRGQARLEYMGSKFDNDYQSVTWDNPFALGFGDDVAQSALAPDNKFHQISLAGSFRFSSRVRLSGKVLTGKAKQNEPFLPYSTNPKYDDLALPRDSLNGKLDTTMYNLSGRLYIMLADRLDLTAKYKKNKRKNKTPVDIYTPVLLDVFESDPRTNRPYSYDRSQLVVDLRYRPTYKIRLNAGYKWNDLKRTYQEVRKTTENSYWGQFQLTPWAWLDTRLKLEILDRDSGMHEQQGNYDRAEHPLMRKYNMADRDRTRTTLEFGLTPLDRLAVNISYYTTRDDYNNSVIGLTDGKESSVNLDLNYAWSEKANFYGFVTKDRIKSTLSGAPRVTAVPWTSNTRDKILTWGAGVSGRINEKMTYGFDYIWSDSKGDILTDTGADDDPFPTLKTKLRNARVYLNYKLSERWGLGLDYYNEKYDTDDWYIDGLGPTDINSVLTMGDLSPDYSVNVLRLQATLKY